MTVHSKADLRNRILKDAGVLDIAESASASDSENVDELVQAALEQLEDEDVTPFNVQAGENTDAIPARIFLPLADYVRSIGMSSYGIPPDEKLEFYALRRLRRASFAGQDETPVPAKFY